MGKDCLYQIQPLMATIPVHYTFTIFSSSSSSSPIRRRHLRKVCPPNKPPNLKPLTSRIVHLTRRRQLNQIIEEIEAAKRRYGRLNTIVMNAVMEACVHCGDVDLALRIFDEMAKPESCGVDAVTYGTLLKGLGKARRIDEAFQILESVEQGTAVGSPNLSAQLIFGLLNALIEMGDLRRANGLLARYGFLLREGSSPSVLIYNLLMKGHIRSVSYQAAINLYDEILHLGLEPDRLTYNTLILACVKNQKLDSAIRFLEEMKDKAQIYSNKDLYPDNITYTTLLKGFGEVKDSLSVQKIVLDMKSRDGLYVDRTALTAIIDAMLDCGLIKGALCTFGEILKRGGADPDLRPKPHLYLSLMRAFSVQGNYDMVRNLCKRMWSDSSGKISPEIQEEADHLLVEAAFNGGRVDVAIENLSITLARWKGISWMSRGGMVAVCIEALLGITKSMFTPYLLPQVMLREPIETIMMPFEGTRPLLGTLQLKKVVMRFFREPVVPIIDEWGSCVGVLHREDCIELNAPLMAMMRSPPPCVTASTSISHVIDLVLQKRYKMVIVIKYSNLYGTPYSSNSRAVGVFTAEQLCKLIEPAPEIARHKFLPFKKWM